MAIRRVPYEQYMDRAMAQAVQEENERLRERCHRLVFEREELQGRVDSLTERVVFQGVVLEEIQEIVADLEKQSME